MVSISGAAIRQCLSRLVFFAVLPLRSDLILYVLHTNFNQAFLVGRRLHGRTNLDQLLGSVAIS
jgi:hypothetical protein